MKKKILHCIGFFENDKYYRVNYYINELKKYFDVSLITYTKRWGIQENDYDEGIISNDGYLQVRIKPSFALKDLIYFRYEHFFLKIDPQAVHIYDAKQLIPFFVAKLCVKRNIKYIYEHEQRDEGRTYLGRIRYKLVTRYLLRYLATNASLIRVATLGAKNLLLKECGQKVEEKIRLSSLFYSPAISFKSKLLRHKFRTENSYFNKDVVFAITGNFLSESKKIHLIINVFRIINNPNFKLLIQGRFVDSYYENTIIKIANYDWLKVNNYTLNPCSLNELFNGIDYAIYTSPTNSFFESLGAGTPVLVPRGSATEHLTNNNIYKYGGEHNIDYSSNLIKNDSIVDDIVNLISVLKLDYTKIDPPKEYSQEKFITELVSQYRNLLKD